MAMSLPVKRLWREFLNISKDPPDLCSAGPVEYDMHVWEAVVIGPQGSPYEGGIFFLDIVFPRFYPFKPPRVQFRTRIYHPNVNTAGRVGLDILTTKWSPVQTVYKVLLSISSMLSNPSPYHILIPEIATVYTQDRPKYELMARAWTKKYAM